ncbi:MAG: alpha-amylase [Bacteroidales bacterium]|nr:alpha-amylase [Bacteroidales bacterium]
MEKPVNGVMMQFYHWHLHENLYHKGARNLWEFLEEQVPYLGKLGITAVWLPPVSKCKNTNDVGYGVYDYYNLGEWGNTKYGSKQQLHHAINALHGYDRLGNKIPGAPYIQVYADIVINHKDGDLDDSTWQAVRVEKENRNRARFGNGFEEGIVEVKGYTKFAPDKNQSGKYSMFEWHARHFDGIDWTETYQEKGHEKDGNNSKYIYRFLFNEENYQPQQKSWDEWLSLEKGNYDYLTFADFDYDRYEVREELKKWGQWLTETLGIDGYRIDAAKHINFDYLREWIGHIRHFGKKTGAFTVAEYLTGNNYVKQEVHDFIDRISRYGEYPQELSVFDFPLHQKFHEISKANGNGSLIAIDHSTMMNQRPMNAVTFVENHDTQYERHHESAVESWFKPLAYSFILLRRNGYPCIFFDDFYGSNVASKSNHVHLPGEEYLGLLLKLRQQFALGEERYYDSEHLAGWVRMGFVPTAKGAMAVVLNNGEHVSAISMNTGRFNKRFYMLATIKHTPGGYLVVYNRYDAYGNNAEGLFTDHNGIAGFPCDAKAVSLWLEDGVGIS